ncbi:tRNA dimethylallyltransferase [Microbacterium azadirachtae]|uniref:tRNA dimethylallyltransferase n=1 Tax=Microbacterium azadirachtae TaxID=582680 RepID=A0A1I6GCL1_9MICO|nr:tRNA dimethylallyltransferase [Microbacterium azadirachtae]
MTGLGAGSAPEVPEAPGTTAPRLWVIVGATGTGKSDLSLDLAEAVVARGRRAEIVNADAMQLYRGMDIGTAKLAEDERRGITHHLFDALEVSADAAVAWYQPRARAAISEILSRGADAILVGGSGLYVSSVLYDFRFPPRDPDLRARLEAELEERGAGPLLARLQDQDPETAARIDPRNGRRIVRALEVLAQGERTHGAALPERPVLWRADSRVLALGVERERLVERLDRRVERMWAQGMLAEVECLRGEGLENGTTARRAIGYAQALAQLEGALTEQEAIAETQALTRRYARRQVSWFRRYAEAEWLDALAPIDVDAIVEGDGNG